MWNCFNCKTWERKNNFGCFVHSFFTQNYHKCFFLLLNCSLLNDKWFFFLGGGESCKRIVFSQYKMLSACWLICWSFQRHKYQFYDPPFDISVRRNSLPPPQTAGLWVTNCLSTVDSVTISTQAENLHTVLLLSFHLLSYPHLLYILILSIEIQKHCNMAALQAFVPRIHCKTMNLI